MLAGCAGPVQSATVTVAEMSDSAGLAGIDRDRFGDLLDGRRTVDHLGGRGSGAGRDRVGTESCSPRVSPMMLIADVEELLTVQMTCVWAAAGSHTAFPAIATPAGASGPVVEGPTEVTAPLEVVVGATTAAVVAAGVQAPSAKVAEA